MTLMAWPLVEELFFAAPPRRNSYREEKEKGSGNGADNSRV